MLSRLFVAGQVSFSMTLLLFLLSVPVLAEFSALRVDFQLSSRPIQCSVYQNLVGGQTCLFFFTAFDSYEFV